MDKKEAKKRILKLRDEIRKRNYEYFVLDKSVVSEAVRDSLKKELIKLESQFPEFITKDSPTQRVGSALSGKLPKIKHITVKKSLQDVFSDEELLKWEERIQKLVPGQKIEYLCEVKIDGLNITLRYKKGRLDKAVTRGNGKIGEDVTHTIKTLESIPLKLREEVDLEVSGEVFMPKKSLEKVNKEQKKVGKELFANCRNAAAGSIRQLNPKIAAGRKLDLFLYEIGKNNIKEKLETQEEVLEKFKDLGLRVSDQYKKVKNIKGVIDFYHHIQKIRSKLPYDIDGLVIKVNSKKQQEKMGFTAKFPRGQAAFKFPAEQSTSRVLGITVQVGRTGALTPVAELEPTLVAGSTISRATLHNEDEINKKDVRIGDTVIIQKAGDVIPEVVEVMKNLRTGKEKKFKFPHKCPICGAKAHREKGESAWRCTNTNCDAREIEKIIHFVGKHGFDIDGLGEKVVVQLVNNKLIKDPADIFTLTAEDFYKLELFKEKRTQNLITAIGKARKIPIDRFLFALGIRYLGEQTCHDFAKYILMHKKKSSEKIKRLKKEKTAQMSLLSEKIEEKPKGFTILDLIESAKAIDLEDLVNLDGIGKVVGESIHKWFREAKNLNYLKKLYKVGVDLKEIKISGKQKLSGKSFVITGSLENLTRDQAKTLIKDNGGKVLSSVSVKTDYLVAGEKPGSKLKKAEKLGVKVIGEKQLFKMAN